MHHEGENPLHNLTAHEKFVIYRHGNSSPGLFLASKVLNEAINFSCR